MTRNLVHFSRMVRAEWLVVGLLLAHLVMKVALWPRMVDAPLTGDEIATVDAARALSNVVHDALSLSPPHMGEVAQSVIGNGWFMPGTSILLAPLVVVHPDAGPTAVRLYMGVFTFLLLVAAVFAVRRLLGHAFACALLVVPGLVPMWVLFSYTAWGDLSAGLVAVVLVACFARTTLKLKRGEAPTFVTGLLFGFLGIVCLYLRSSTLPLVACLLALWFVGALVFLRGSQRVKGAAVGAVSVVTVCGLLSPWSIAASTVLHDRVTTTTTVPLSTAVAFGDAQRLCFGPCDPGNIWFSSVRYSREVARATGLSELEVQRQMSDYALTDLTLEHYAGQVIANFRRYLFRPAEFESRFRPPGPGVDRASSWIVATTRVAYFSMLAVLVCALLVATRSSFRNQALSILIKLATATLMVQPFLHVSSGRYWPLFIPMSALAAALLTQLVPRRTTKPRAEPTTGMDNPFVQPLFWMQIMLSLGIVVTAAALGVLAA